MTVRTAVSVPATSANLGPGYDAFGAAVSLRVVVGATDRSPDGARVVTHGEGAGEVSTGEDNLVWASLVSACERFGWDVPDVTLHVHNPIPLARGMGSSSAAIIGGLAIARALAGADPSVAPDADVEQVGDTALTELSTEIEGHPDNVAPAVHGGLVACAPRDDGRFVVRLSPPPATTRPVMLVPATRQLTSEARGVVPDQLSTPDVAAQAARAGHVLGGLLGAWPVDPTLAGDRLHEPPRAEVMPVAAELMAALRADGHHAWLSGAGPTVAVAVGLRDEAALDAVRALAASRDHEVLVLDWDKAGVIACIPGGCGVSGGSDCAVCPLRSLQ